MENLHSKKELADGFTVSVFYDTDYRNPREDYDNVDTLALFDKADRHCGFGDKHGYSDEQLANLLKSPRFHALPVFMYEHSGQSINTTGFSCGWDSGLIGVIYMTKEQSKKEGITDPLEYMRGQVNTLDDCLRGNVYGFAVTNGTGETVASCWGFIGDADYCMSEGEAMAEYCIKEAREAAAKREADLNLAYEGL